MSSYKQSFLTYGKMTTILLIITVSVLLSGCAKNNPTSEDADMAQQEPFKLTSTAFEDGGRIDLKHTFSDQNLSVPLAWANPPEGTKSFAILMVDLHPVASNWIHWAAKDIPADVRELTENSSQADTFPKGSTELRNTFDFFGYGGPQPPSGSGDHEYKFILYALNAETVDLPERVSYASFEQVIEQNIIEKAELSGFYESK